ncbi:7-dehydrocholesterol reductase-like [Amphiura filiformis]|uniref:7-dehydrocholesterol reductase-like n=1 Tax=Amphiura filiformis TaxID=82378 RepID=UPI003B2131B9
MATRSRRTAKTSFPFTSKKTGHDDTIEIDDGRKPGQWGRAWEVDLFSLVAIICLLIFCPPMVFYFYVSCTHYDCALSAPLLGILIGDVTVAEFWSQLPPITADGFKIVLSWMAFQVILTNLPDLFHKFVPGYVGGIQPGSGITPSGEHLHYQINGLQAFCISNGLFLLNGFIFQWVSPTIVVDHCGEMLWVANILGYLVSILVYIKGHTFPTSPKDCKFSGYFLYDFMMGIELNPRIGKWFDFKMFFNIRPGMIAWTIINMSNAIYQYQMHGYVTNSMWIVNIIQGIYVFDTFWNEAWYVGTIDILHDHFGWMFGWGDCVWLPWMYTIQGFYLAYKPVDLPLPIAVALLTLGLVGLFIYRAVNSQKDYFRRTDGQGLIWGAKPKYLEATYYTSDSKKRMIKLLLSGWWGVTRHMNYTGELMLSTACCLACGLQGFMPYFYILFVFILMTHRCIRDEHRCKAKYGRVWDEYMSKVPHRLIPGVF